MVSPYLKPSRDFGSRCGAFVIDSMPPATTISASPARISWSAMRDRVEAGEAHLVDGDRRDAHRDAAGDAGGAGGVLPGAGQDDLAHDHVVDLVAGDAGLLEGALDGDTAEVGGRQVLEPAEQPADRRTGTGDDDGSGHGVPPAEQIGCRRRRYPAPRAAEGRPPRGDEEHVTRRCGPARPRRTTMAAMTLDVPDHLFTAIDHVGIAVPDLDEAIAFYRDTFGMETGPRGDQRGAGRARGDGRRRRLRLLHPAARPARPRLDDREVPRPLRPGHAAARLPGRPTSRPCPRSCASAASACCTTTRARHGRLAGSTSCTPRTPAACSSSSSSPPARYEVDAPTSSTRPSWTAGYRLVISAPRRPTDQETPCSTSSTPSWPATPPPRTSPPSSSPSPTAPSPSTRTRSTCSRGCRARDKDPRKSLHVDDVPLPELGPGEALSP